MIKKFKTFDEAQQDLWCFNPDEAYYKRVKEFYELASHLIKRKPFKGVLKFKTFEETQAHRESLRIESQDSNKI
ncbi:hypothetical protein MASR1M107_31200 [Ignavibacteriales bacterium]